MNPKIWLHYSQAIAVIICQLRIFIVNTIKTLPRDLTALYRLHKVKLWLIWLKLRNVTVAKLFDNVVKEHPEKVCFYFEGDRWSFKKVQEYSNKVAQYFSDKGFQKGDCIALMISNKPEFVCLWLGLSRIGVITSWININLRQDSLIHCLKIGNPKAAIIGGECLEAISEIHPEIATHPPANFEWFIFNKIKSSKNGTPKKSRSRTSSESNNLPKSGNAGNFCTTNLLPKLEETSFKRRIYSKKVHFEDVLCYVFTSGTTGLVKAALMTHSRMIAMVYGPHYLTDLNINDTLYTPLPLYHVQGGICGVGQALLFGISQVIVPKFSASRFWSDCVKHNATVAQYLGEVCRYLLKHSSPLERAHSVKKFYGNGMKTDIWKTFLDRFNYPVITELYGASEGNCQLGNFEGVIGACGSSPYGLLERIFPPPIQLFHVDEDSGELLRNPKTGFATPCKANERGELLGLISDGPLREFLGYTDHTATKEKVVFDVKSFGDCYFRSGDILRQDSLNYFHFLDRLGSSFRWKGNNVSSEEVTLGFSRIVGLDKDIVTFGVSIPHTDGKAGMTVIAVKSLAEPNKLAELVGRVNGSVNEVLPSFARPIFIRFVEEIGSTGTFKLQKTTLQEEGFKVSTITDPVYILVNGNYVEFAKDFADQVNQGEIKL